MARRFGPRFSRFASFRRATVDADGQVKSAPRREPGKMNANEERYADHLTERADVIEWHFEAMKLRLADGTFIEIDFMVFRSDWTMELHEVKAYWKNLERVHIEDDARVKLKWCQDKYPFPILVMYLDPALGQWKEHAL